MKRTFLISLAFCMLISLASAQTAEDIKYAKKEAKTAAKQLTKDGYKLLELGDLQTQMEKYLAKTNSGAKQIIGTAESCITVNLGKVTALNNALNEYASLEGGIVKGRITSDAANIDGDQRDNIVAAYERLLVKELKGEVQTQITLVKERNGKFDVRLYCLVDTDSAHKARKKAMEQAMEEQKMIQEYGSQVSNWIDEGFK